MSLLTNKRSILAKIEATYNTDPTPTGAANAILCSNMNFVPQETNLVQRSMVRPYLSNDGQVIEGAHCTIDFDVELAGSGAAGTAPGYGCLLRACGFSETINVGTSVIYAPISSAFESATIYANIDGVLHKISGIRGTVAFDMNAKQIPVMKFKLTGLYTTPTDAAAPVATYTTFQKPLIINNTNSSGFSLHGYSGVLGSLSIDMANTVTYRSLVGLEDVRITDRKPAGSIAIEAVNIASKDFFTIAKAGTTGALALQHGTTAGNIISISAPAVQLTKPTYQDSDNVQMLQMSMDLQPSSGNDEFTLTVK